MVRRRARAQGSMDDDDDDVTRVKVTLPSMCTFLLMPGSSPRAPLVVTAKTTPIGAYIIIYLMKVFGSIPRFALTELPRLYESCSIPSPPTRRE